VVGILLGDGLGSLVGCTEGDGDGSSEGDTEGSSVGFTDGEGVGSSVGCADGLGVGSTVGSSVGDGVGSLDGDRDGSAEGESVGASDSQIIKISAVPDTSGPLRINVISSECPALTVATSCRRSSSRTVFPAESNARIFATSKSDPEASIVISPSCGILTSTFMGSPL